MIEKRSSQVYLIGVVLYIILTENYVFNRKKYLSSFNAFEKSPAASDEILCCWKNFISPRTRAFIDIVIVCSISSKKMRANICMCVIKHRKKDEWKWENLWHSSSSSPYEDEKKSTLNFNPPTLTQQLHYLKASAPCWAYLEHSRPSKEQLVS